MQMQRKKGKKWEKYTNCKVKIGLDKWKALMGENNCSLAFSYRCLQTAEGGNKSSAGERA